ncbi:MAG: aminotransferase class I/II-fold pyridoxal phosphate-dependent enzyme [Lachnospiraceae bacterium]|nr:aminotransferase class I/II-fold pyridoxal phosphate-dependent enzyme [Lachnospiraceae bacterium]
MSWEDKIRKVVPYVAGEQPVGKVIKLNTNEFPYPPSPMVATRIYDMAQDEIDASDNMLRKYPNMDADKLVRAISQVYGIDYDKIFVGVGSDDVLAMAFLTYFNSDKPILFPDITYSFYDVWADVYRIPYEQKKLDEDFKIIKEDYLGGNCGGIVIPNPNAPTGVLEEVSFFEDIIKNNPDCIVIIDEAYIDFGGESALPLIDKYDNVVVVQTFSKSRALAGLRIGMAFANPKLIGYLKDVKFSVNSYTMNYPAIELGAVAVLDTEYFEKTVGMLIKTRENTKKELKKLGFKFADSKSNFVFASHESMKAKDIFLKLKERNIYVRHWDKPRIDNYLRISIGTDDEMKELINALKEILN